MTDLTNWYSRRFLHQSAANMKCRSQKNGRFIAASCGVFVSVVDLKTNKEQNYCIIDGGINHINYYGQTTGNEDSGIYLCKGRCSIRALTWQHAGSLHKPEQPRNGTTAVTVYGR